MADVNPYGNTMFNPMMMQNQGYNPMTQPNGQGGYMAPATGGDNGFLGGLQGVASNMLGGLGNQIAGNFISGLTNSIFQQPAQMQEMQALPEFTNQDMGTMYGQIGLNNAVGQSNTGLGQNSSSYQYTARPEDVMKQYESAQQSVTDYNAEAQKQNNANSGVGGFFTNIGKNLGFVPR
jgi:hypothetical protein